MAKHYSPIGTSVSEHVQRKLARNQRYREAYDRLAPFEQIARIAIMRRAQLGLSQQQLAEDAMILSQGAERAQAMLDAAQARELAAVYK